MIVVKPRYSVRKYCYGGSGFFDTILKNVTSSAIAQKVVNAATKDGLKSVINKVGNSSITHKVVDAVVNGATSATQKAVENAITDILKRKAPTDADDDNNTRIVKKRKINGGKLKRKLPETETEARGNKKIKINLSNLINGSGIVLD